MRDLDELYKDIFSKKQIKFAKKNNISMNATNIEMWYKSRYVFYFFAIIGNIVSFIGCAYGIHLYLADSMPSLLTWLIGIVFAAGLEVTFVFAYKYATIKIFQKRYKYAIPFLILSSFYGLVYFPTTYGFESFAVKTDVKVVNLKEQFSRDSLHIARTYNTQIDSLNNRILLLEKKRQGLKFYVDIQTNNKARETIQKEKNKLVEAKENRLIVLAEKYENKFDETQKNLSQTSKRHLNLAIIILIYVFVAYTVIYVIQHFADEEYRQFHEASFPALQVQLPEKKKTIQTAEMKLIKKKV